MSHSCIVLLLIIGSFTFLSAAVTPIAADDKTEKAASPKTPKITVVDVTIRPAAEPRPVLKYHLLPTYMEQTPGNAVPLYLKALIQYVDLRKEWQHQALESLKKHPSEEPGFDRVDEWLDMPLEKLPREQLRQFVDRWFRGVYRALKEATERERCDWEMPTRQGRAFEVLLPEHQELRWASNTIALQARLQIAEGKNAEALETLRVGYAVARHAAAAPFLVTTLIGQSIADRMNAQLLTLCQQPGAPNLYWSLTELPHPMFDVEHAIAAEYDGLYLQWPELRKLRTADYAPAQWDIVLHDFVAEMVRCGVFVKNDLHVPDSKKAAVTAEIVKQALDALPVAKKGLLDAGYTQQQVDAMAPAQIVMLDAVNVYEQHRDDLMKWVHLPCWQARDGLTAADRRLQEIGKRGGIYAYLMLIPNTRSAVFLPVQTERQLAAMRVIEALRLYMASHDGRLPASLDDVKEVPIPTNPMTGKPFPYRLDGPIAVLDADGDKPVQWRITAAR
jgi:hypothetical protein